MKLNSKRQQYSDSVAASLPLGDDFQHAPRLEDPGARYHYYH